ncbi:hypothetical protein FOZ62_003609 [Perkinsus olseni]|uniref:Nudix hydrolase domain-containing protein n=1 Tax=Perkinsus olseni TaxID=32597 RepID=A0A7J6UEV7_PEROL|nr:hypothetical protein FOZ62_003609 [Perkinsus olseni]
MLQQPTAGLIHTTAAPAPSTTTRYTPPSSDGDSRDKGQQSTIVDDAIVGGDTITNTPTAAVATHSLGSSINNHSSHYADPEVWSPTKEYKLRAGCVVYDEAGTNILLVNSTRHGSDRMTHTIPSGKVESFDQDLETAAVRETIEEAGVECSVIWDLGWYKSSTKTGQPTVTRLFLAQSTNVLSTWRESEFRERMWCSVSRALSLLGRKKPHYRLALHMAANAYAQHGHPHSPLITGPSQSRNNKKDNNKMLTVNGRVKDKAPSLDDEKKREKHAEGGKGGEHAPVDDDSLGMPTTGMVVDGDDNGRVVVDVVVMMMVSYKLPALKMGKP